MWGGGWGTTERPKVGCGVVPLRRPVKGAASTDTYIFQCRSTKHYWVLIDIRRRRRVFELLSPRSIVEYPGFMEETFVLMRMPVMLAGCYTAGAASDGATGPVGRQVRTGGRV
jgi:hypothetical protein